MRNDRAIIVMIAVLEACSGLKSAPATGSAPPNRGPLVSTPASWPLDRVDQRSLPLDGVFRRRGSGRGVTVYLFGAGISIAYTDLLGRLRQGFSAFPADRSVCDGQSTAIGGAIAGSHFGVASEATVVDVKIVDCRSGQMTPGAIANAARWVIADHAARGGPALVAWPFIADTVVGQLVVLRQAKAALAKAGLAVITGARADEGPCAFGGAEHESTATVAPMDTTFLTTQSAGSPTVDQCTDLVAPDMYPDAVWQDGHVGSPPVIWRGAGIAAGYVSGAAAVLLERHPGSSAKQLLGELVGTATPDSMVGAPQRHLRLLYIGVNR